MEDQEENPPFKTIKYLTDLGGSKAIVVPARIVRKHKWTAHTVLELEATEDGFIVRTK